MGVHSQRWVSQLLAGVLSLLDPAVMRDYKWDQVCSFFFSMAGWVKVWDLVASLGWQWLGANLGQW